MNNRIKELLQLVGGNECQALLNSNDLEKFAELIVKECVDGIKSWRDASDEQMDKDEYWRGYRSGCNDAIVEIQENFGVEL